MLRSRRSLLFIAFLLLLVLSPLFLSPSAAVGKKKLSDKELQDLEDQWFEDEEDDPTDLTRWRKGPDGERAPPRPATKSEMAFVALRKPITKDETSDWGGKASDILSSGGVDVKAYPVESGKVLFVADKGAPDMLKVKEYVLKQDKVVDFEWNQKKYYPNMGGKPAAAGHELDIEKIKAQLAAGQGPYLNRDKPPVDETQLGGAGGPIPAEMPDEL